MDSLAGMTRAKMATATDPNPPTEVLAIPTITALNDEDTDVTHKLDLPEGWTATVATAGATELTFGEALSSNLRVVDAAAFSLCMDNHLPMLVFGIDGEDAITRAIRGEKIGTLVTAG